jgi:hypothetical protein
VTCKSCRNYLKDTNIVPEHAACNKFEVGVAPAELTCLIDVELAFMSPITAMPCSLKEVMKVFRDSFFP